MAADHTFTPPLTRLADTDYLCAQNVNKVSLSKRTAAKARHQSHSGGNIGGNSMIIHSLNLRYIYYYVQHTLSNLVAAASTIKYVIHSNRLKNARGKPKQAISL
jgi:hypothetical protein